MIDVEAYCRAIEAHLCRRNDGHLIRLVGPAFECVVGWARQGIPLRVAETGIDRTVERHARKGPRRRPLRVEFCEADVLDAFDDWRRAVGVSRVAADAEGGPLVEEPATPAGRSRRSLASTIDRLLARLTVLRGSDRAGAPLTKALDEAARALDAIRSDAAGARGAARDAVLDRMAAIEAALVGEAASALGDAEREAYEREAESELAPFRARMSDEAFAAARRAALRRLASRHFDLPSFE